MKKLKYGRCPKNGFVVTDISCYIKNVADPPQPARPRPTALLSPRSNGKPEAATAVVELLMMGVKMPETC